MTRSLRVVSVWPTLFLIACANGTVDISTQLPDPNTGLTHVGSDASTPDGGTSAPDSGGQVGVGKQDTPDGGTSIQGGDGGPDSGGPSCTPSCPEGACGFLPDGCGGFASCGTCALGEVCGLNEADRCGAIPSSCTPHAAAEVCAGKCGAVSDGCSDILNCDASNGGMACTADQICGGYTGAIQPNVCVEKPQCVPQSCTSLGAECGLQGDGCGGTLDCTMEHGCPNGQTCGTGVLYGVCVDVSTVTQCIALTPELVCAGKCGTQSDGCTGTYQCDDSNGGTTCDVVHGESCGGGGTPSHCGSGAMSCEPIDPAIVCAGPDSDPNHNKCGTQSDGCTGTYQCDDSNGGHTCDAVHGESCGGGGTASTCGKPACVAKTFEQACPGSGGHASCGYVSDGCGDLIACGLCSGEDQCGLTAANLCGSIPACQPVSDNSACSGKCGTVPNGCGDSINCTGSNGGVTCTGDQYCGASTANQCGSPVVTCAPKSCGELGHTCGLASDGCGHLINCWPGCSPTNSTCTGSCGDVASCLANGTTGIQSCVAAAGSCSGSLCGALPTGCATSSPTQLTGTVHTPGRLVGATWINQLPVPNALVYIPSDPGTALPSIFEGVDPNSAASCGRCEDEKLVADGETLLAAAVTDFRGQFTLKGRIPIGTAFNVVVKVGKWRRVVQVPSGIAVNCATRALADQYTRLSASTVDGLTGTHLPKIAISTGQVDAMECVLRGIGIDDSEFSVPSGSGRLHMYRANGTRMGAASGCSGTYTSQGSTVQCTANSNSGCVNHKTGCTYSGETTVANSTLYASQAAMNAYDIAVFDCEGSHQNRASDALGRLLAYTNAGGRVFASHWSYDWLDNNGTMDGAAAWNQSSGETSSGTGLVSLPMGNTARTGANAVKSLVYRNWLDYVGALTGTVAGDPLENPATPQFPITDPRDVAGMTVGASTDEWMYRKDRNFDGDGAGTLDPTVQQLSFNTPYGAAENLICGRVAFSAFHVSSASNGSTLSTSNTFFPGECNNTTLTSQEKTLAFMLFDLATCVSTGDPPAPPSCNPKTTADLCPTENAACGYLSDGCGDVVDCAGCSSGYYCDGNQCRRQECTPATCGSLGYNCGTPPDGCGGVARDALGHEGCGTCSEGQTCGLGGPGVCGSSSCAQISMNAACPNNWCGMVSDGCGGSYNCGGCSTGVCGGGGANQCGQNACTPITIGVACASKNCGVVSNGCGGTINCGQCTAPLSCGGGGTANVCGQPICTPLTTQQACHNLECGWVSNGCGGAISCGSCPSGGVCGGSGPNLCGSSCAPRTCNSVHAECGAISDLCGSIVQCGNCPAGQTCGAGGANKCGNTACTPTTCNAAGAQCGLIGDGCGNVLDCGTCTAPETCGGAGVANHCGIGEGGCSPLSCGDQMVQCGAASDGCGGLLDCGGCGSGQYCKASTCMSVLQ